ncbi:nucleotidyltransferase domain-containing protein [Marinomonas aquimarina]
MQHLMPDVRLIYLFGSQADGSATPSSDIDVAVLLERKLDPVARFQ